MPPTQSKTKPGPRKLSDVAKHLVAPADIVSTGWPAVRKTCIEKMGIEFDDWQDSTGRLILAKRADGHLACMVDGVGMSIPRQVGKTFTVASLVFGLSVNRPGLLVIWSAHHARTHAETFLAMQAFAKRTKVAPHVAQIFTGSGTEEIRFHNGSRILFGARERGFGRGIPGVDVLVSDEAQILSDKAMANMIATMNTSQFGLALFMGTPPKPDDMSDGFTRMRTDALEGRLADGAWIEFGADDDAKPGDRKQWAKANPSYPKRTPAQSILRMQRKLTEADFLREALGVWGDSSDVGLVNLAVWAGLYDRKADVEDRVTFGIDTTPERSFTSIGLAGTYRGKTFVDLGPHHAGTRWVVDACIDLRSRYPGAAFAVDEQGPAASLIQELEDANVPVVKLKTQDCKRACGWFYDEVNAGNVVHLDNPLLTAAVQGLKKRDVGDAWLYDRKKKSAVISPYIAVTWAAWAAQNNGPSIYESRGSLLLG
jgi:hypothetical protein